MNNKNYILIALLLILFILGSIFIYQILQKPKENNLENLSENQQTEIDNFDKVLTGYVVFQEKELPSREDFEKYYWDIPPESSLVKETYVYFRITDYTDKGFIKELEEGINQGNTINNKNGEDFLFNIGCLENNKIKVDGIDTNNYMNEDTRKMILESNEENPIKIIIKLDAREGHGCRCCSFAEKIRLYENN